ncbi:ArsR/SmtB family transcription factor [Streptomyces sp. NPDC059982]|uniref:ArsR/SmtB family transcription factor n=1 Tax=unclassified Streptomyces TaxID=2593676 RepID=UPI003673E4E1
MSAFGEQSENVSPTHPSAPGAGRRPPARHRALAALLGATRAQVLLLIAIHAEATTSDLVEELGLSAATVSHHTSVLRHSALIATRRDGGSVHHNLTPLGGSLLRAHGLPGAPRHP